MKTIYFSAMVFFLVQVTVSAQNRDGVSIDDYYVDYSVPDITAFSILGVNTNEVVRPGNVKEFAAGVVNYISENGNLKPGLAIELAPYRLLAKSKKLVPAWRRNKSLKNLQISIATAQGDSTNLIAAWGLNWTPVDKTDPVEDKGLQNFFAKYISALGQGEFSKSLTEQRKIHLTDVNKVLINLNGEQRKRILDLFDMDYRERLNRYGEDSASYVANMRDTVMAQLAEIRFQPDTTQTKKILTLISQNAALTFNEDRTEADFTNRFAEEVKKQKQIFIEENWNRLVVQFKAGAKYSAAEGTLNDLSILNYRVFGGLAGRVPGFAKGDAAKSNFAKNSQIVCQANYTSYRDGISSLNWEFSTGGRLLYGKADKRFSGEFQYGKASMKGEIPETLEYIRYTLGGEIKVSEGLWFELAVGGQKFLQGDDATRLVPEFGIKYAIQKKSRF
jgi:hypothetical protein